jgi:hypothetical protein
MRGMDIGWLGAFSAWPDALACWRSSQFAALSPASGCLKCIFLSRERALPCAVASF